MTIEQVTRGIKRVWNDTVPMSNGSVLYSLLVVLLLSLETVVNVQATDSREIVLQFAEESVTCADISRDGERLATGTRSGAIVIWDIASGRRLRVLRLDKALKAVAFSPSGDRVVAVIDQLAWDGNQQMTEVYPHQASVWDLASGTMLQSYHTKRRGRRPPELRGFTTVAFSPYGTEFVTGDTEGNVVLWHARSGKQLWSFGGLGDEWPVSSVDLDASGDLIVATNQERAILWNRRTGKVVRELTKFHRRSRGFAAFSGDGKTIVTTDSEHDMRQAILWEVETGRRIGGFRKPEEQVFSIALNHDGSRCVINSVDHDATLWSTNTGERLGQFRSEYGIGAVGFMDDIPFALSGALQLVNVRVGDVIGKIEPKWRSSVDSLDYCADGSSIVIGSYNQIALWDPTTGARRAIVDIPGFRAQRIACSPHGEYILAGSDRDEDGAVCLWDVSRRTRVARYRGGLRRIQSVGFSGDGRFALTASFHGVTHVWRVDTGEVEHRLVEAPSATSPSEMRAVKVAKLSHRGNYAATGGYGHFTLWDLRNERPVETVLKRFPDELELGSGSLDRPVAFEFDRNEMTLYMLTEQGRVLLWETQTGERKAYFRIQGDRFRWAKVLPDGQIMACSTADGVIRLVDLKSQSVSRKIEGVYGGEFALSPDGDRMVSSTGNAARMWDTKSGRLLATFHSFNGAADWLTITPEGFFVGTAGANEVVMRRVQANGLAVEQCEELNQLERVVAALRSE